MTSWPRRRGGRNGKDEGAHHPPELRELEANIICPYCGNIDRDSFERSDEDTTECMRCGGIIHYQRIVTIEYTTEPVKPPKLIRAHWVKDT